MKTFKLNITMKVSDNWIEYNYGLSLREVLDFRAALAIKLQARCFKQTA
jgi:hypothetical protein